MRKAVTELHVLSEQPKARLARLRNHIEQIEDELFNRSPGALAIAHHCVSLILIEVWRASSPLNTEQVASPQKNVDDFLHLVELHLQSHWTVRHYAEYLGISRDSLNSAVQRAIGSTPHQHVQSRLMEEAKSLLVHSNLQVAEVAYKLGFSDAAYFNRFFQRHAAIPPGKFRKTHSPADRERLKDDSFAAWP